MSAFGALRERLPPWTGPLLLWRLGMLLLVYGVIWLLPGLFDAQSWAVNFHYPPRATPVLEDMWSTWDVNHYLHLAEQGYVPGAQSNAFYPLWPTLMRWTSAVTGTSTLVAGYLLANLLALLAGLGFHHLARARVGEEAADRSLLLLLAFPGAFFLGLPYTEALFLLLAVGTMLALHLERPGLAAGAALLAPLCRPVGIFLVLPLFVHRALAKDPGAGAGRLRALLRPASADGLVLAPLVGWGLYFLWMYLASGNALEGFDAQEQFRSGSSILRLLDPIGFLALFARSLSLHGFSDSLLDRLWFVLFLATLPALWRLDKRWFAYALPMGLIPAVTVQLLSFTRYALVVFPCFVVAGVFFSAPERRRWFGPVLFLLLGFQVLLLGRHVNNLWAG